MPEQLPSDPELLRRMSDGDESAFTELYLRRQPAVYRFALQMSGSCAVAEDVVQETFLTLIRIGAKYDPKRGSVAAYLAGIARNHVLRALARGRGEEEPDHELADRADLHAAVIRARLVSSLRAAVLALPVHYREVVVLCDLQEMDYADAAGALGCPTGTVRSRLHRARQLLAGRLCAPAERGVSGTRCSV